MNEHMGISRVGQMKHIESQARRYSKKYQADRQSFDAQLEGERVSGHENKYCVWYQSRSLGRWLANYISSQERGISLATGCTGESGFDPVEFVGYGPTMWVKDRKSGVILHGYDNHAGQTITCRLCRQQRRYQGRGTKWTIFLLIERGGPIRKVLVHRWLPECHQQQ